MNSSTETTDNTDDDAWIEAEIQRQLDALTLHEDEEDEDEEEEDYQSPLDSAEDIDDDIDVPDSVAQYLEKVQHRSENVEKDLQECDDILQKASQNQRATAEEEDEFYYESAELKELAFQLGEDPEELRDRVMSEVQKGELQDAEDAEREDATSRMEDEKADDAEGVPGNQDGEVEEGETGPKQHQKDKMVVALISGSDKYEQAARAKIRELEGRQSQMDHARHEDRERELQEQARRDRQTEDARMQKQKELDAEQQRLAQERMVTQAKADVELEEETKQQEESLKKYQAEIEEFARKMEEEKEQLEKQLKGEKERKDKQVYDAAVTIQAAYRSYRVRKPYLKKLRQLQVEREESKIQLRQMEIAEQRRQAEMKKKKEKAEKKKREEAEKKKQKELQKRLEAERKEQERKEKDRQEMERKEKEKQDAERLEAERLEKERLEKEREEQEKEKLEMEQKTHDILAKIAAEKGIKSTGLNIAETSDETNAKGTGDDSATKSTNKDASSEPTSGDLGVKGQVASIDNIEKKDDNNSDNTISLLTDGEKSNREVANHVDQSSANNPSTSESFKSSLSLNQISRNLDARTKDVDETKLAVDSNDNIENKSSDTIVTNKSAKNTDHTSIVQENDRNRQSQPSTTRTKGAFKSIQENFNSNNHVSSQRTVTDKVGNSSDVVKSSLDFDERTPSIKDGRAPSSDDAPIAPDISLEPLPEDVEKLRLQWMEKCTSLSKLLSDSKQKVDHSKQRRQLRRPRSAKKLPDVTDEQIITGSVEKSTLDQVSTVLLEDLPGFNLSTLRKCPRLQCLTIHRCGLTAVEGLENSPDLVAVDVKHNGVESVNCRDRSQLSVLQLAHNHLTNLQGLEGCPRLRWLEVQHNKLTRISGIESVSSLTHLYASHNQLLNTAGLDALVCLQRLDLSHNHLSSASGIEKCCLLRRLNLSRNSLTEIPKLTNHVLLREVYLDDNSLSSLDVITNAWLPMLTTLSVSQNSLPNIPILKGCRLLTFLDISHNFIADIDCVSPGLEILHKLEHLSIAGNPVTEEQNCRSAILAAVPHLKKLDDDVLPSNQGAKEPVLSQFEAMCLSQMQAQDDLQTMQQTEMENLLSSNPNNTLQIAKLRTKHMEEVYKQAEEHRYMHEYGDMTIIPRQPNTMRSEGNMRSKGTKGGSQSEKNSSRTTDADRNTTNTERMNRAATQIQALWRGYSLRRDIAQTTAYWLAAGVTQSAWRRYVARRDGIQDDDEDTARAWAQLQVVAAIKIQALWRGHIVRKRLKLAKQTIKFDDEDDMFGEIDLTSFEFNEDSIEQGWLPAATPVLPTSHPVLPPAVPHHPTTSPHKPSPPTGERPLTRQLRQAWRNADSPLADPFNKNLSGKPPLPPTSLYQDVRQSVGRLNLNPSPTGYNEGAFDDRSQQGTPFGKPLIPPSPSTTMDTPRSNRSNKTEKLSEEWGFKDSTTAELMMRRAKKLNKGNMNRKKKQLNPIQRYQKMIKTQDSTTARVTHVQKKGVQRKEYFKAREEEVENAHREKKEEEHERKTRTFDWVHNQVGDFEVSDSRINPHGLSGRQSTSEPNLPRMSPDVILGGRIQLMASPTVELQSVDGTSSVASLTNKNRSNSYSTPDVQLPPIKTNSAPSSHYKERVAAKQGTVTNVHIAWGRTPRSGGNSYR